MNTSIDCAVSRVGTLAFMAPGACPASSPPASTAATAGDWRHTHPPPSPPRRPRVPLSEIVELPRRPAETLELLRSQRRSLYGLEVDIWSIGCVAYEVLFGEALFHGSNDAIEHDILTRTLRVPRRAPTSEVVSAAAAQFIQARFIHPHAELISCVVAHATDGAVPRCPPLETHPLLDCPPAQACLVRRPRSRATASDLLHGTWLDPTADVLHPLRPAISEAEQGGNASCELRSEKPSVSFECTRSTGRAPRQAGVPAQRAPRSYSVPLGPPLLPEGTRAPLPREDSSEADVVPFSPRSEPPTPGGAAWRGAQAETPLRARSGPFSHSQSQGQADAAPPVVAPLPTSASMASPGDRGANLLRWASSTGPPETAVSQAAARKASAPPDVGTRGGLLPTIRVPSFQGSATSQSGGGQTPTRSPRPAAALTSCWRLPGEVFDDAPWGDDAGGASTIMTAADSSFSAHGAGRETRSPRAVSIVHVAVVSAAVPGDGSCGGTRPRGSVSSLPSERSPSEDIQSLHQLQSRASNSRASQRLSLDTPVQQKSKGVLPWALKVQRSNSVEPASPRRPAVGGSPLAPGTPSAAPRSPQSHMPTRNSGQSSQSSLSSGSNRGVSGASAGGSIISISPSHARRTAAPPSEKSWQQSFVATGTVIHPPGTASVLGSRDGALPAEGRRTNVGSPSASPRKGGRFSKLGQALERFFTATPSTATPAAA